MKLFKKDTRPAILIAEDDEMQALFLQTILEHNNYQTAIAANGKEALGQLHRSSFVLVVSDIMMPEMDGYELCQSIKSNDRLKHMPVILMTSLTDPNEVVRGLYSGADSLISKPYDEKFLMSRIEHLLTNQQMQGKAGQTAETAETNPASQFTMRISIGGQKYSVTPERLQTIGLLLSSYEIAVQKNEELSRVKQQLEAREEELKEAQATIERLRQEAGGGQT